jgi:hypothetical protein
MLITLGLLNKLRKTKTCKSDDYKSVCLSWILYFSLNPLTKCPCKGILAGLLRLIGILGKIYVIIPLFRGSLKIYDIFVEKGMAKIIYEIVLNKVQNCVKPAVEEQKTTE